MMCPLWVWGRMSEGQVIYVRVGEIDIVRKSFNGVCKSSALARLSVESSCRMFAWDEFEDFGMNKGKPFYYDIEAHAKV
jgi:hypothetical protein